jgi:hypothetical protein
MMSALSYEMTKWNQLETLTQQNAQYCSLDIYITLNIPTGFDPQGTVIREPNQTNIA